MPTLREAAENYLEAILALEETSGPVKSIDVAAALGVSRPSVNKAVTLLKREGLAEQRRYGRITLTEKGLAHATDMRRRHETLARFLTGVLGVDAAVADLDACRMEHVVSPETMAKLTAYINELLKPSIK